jgi:VWFA-related protein
MNGFRVFVRISLGLALFAPGLTAQDEGRPPVEQEAPIRVDVDLVTLRFTVKDESGRLLNDLDSQQFEIVENGEFRPIQFFEPPRNTDGTERPLWLAFLLDVSGSTFATRGEVILSARTFFENIHGFTQIGVYGFTDQLIPFQHFTSDKAAALSAFNVARRHLGRTAIYDSLNALIGQMKAQAPGNHQKVIIVVSDGIDENFAHHAQSIALARQAGVTIYTIWVPSASQLYIGSRTAAAHSPLPRSDDELAKERAFSRLSEMTGGRHFAGFETILDLDNVLAEINEEVFGNLYSVGYQTQLPYLNRQDRDIQIQVDVPGARAHGVSRKLPEMLDSRKRFIAALFEDTELSALARTDAEFREIGAQLDLMRATREGGRLGVPFRLRINPFGLRQDEREGVRTQLGIIGLLIDQDGAEAVRLREIFRADMDPKDLRSGRSILYTNKMFAPPGTYDFKLAILEIQTWRITLFRDRVHVAEP